MDYCDNPVESLGHYVICGGSCDEHPASTYNYKSGGLVIIATLNDGLNGTPPDGRNDFAPCTNPSYRGGYYGMYEIRCKMPPEAGVWPAFWLFNGPDEMDIMEQFGDVHQFKSSFNDWPGGFSSPGFPPDPGMIAERSCQIDHDFERDITDEWHMFHMVWTPDKISYFFDGVEYRTETRFNYWDCPLEIIFNLHTQNHANFDEADFIIDYVKIYNKSSWDVTDNTTWDSDYMEEYEVRATSGYQANSSIKALAAGEGNSLFFRDINNQMIYSYFANGDINNIITHNLGNIANGGPNSSWDVYGDVVVGENNQVFYPGINGTLQNYYYKHSEGAGGGWQHGFVGLTVEADVGITTKVHLDCGSLDVAPLTEGGNRVFYRGQDNTMHYYFYDPGQASQSNGWVHLNLHQEAGVTTLNSMVSGNVVAANGNKVFYRGADGRIQSFGFDGTNWNHDVVDWSSNTKFLLSAACGSMDAVTLDGTQHLFYRGQMDNRMHYFFWDPSHPDGFANGWVHKYMPYDHSMQLIDGPVQADSDGNVYYGSEPLFGSVLSVFGTYIYYNNDWYHQLAVGGLEQYPPPANSPLINGGIAIGDSWENALIYHRSLSGTVGFLNKIPSDGQLIDLPCFTNLNHHLESSENSDHEMANSRSEFTNVHDTDAGNAVTIFPNPTSNTLMVKAAGQMVLTGELRIVNTLGVICHTQKVAEVSLLELDCTKLPAGIYYLSFLSNNNIPWERTFVVE